MKQLAHNLYTADPNIPEYGPLPGSELFQNMRYGYEKPYKVHGWQWSTTFRKWSALVTFQSGETVFTYPKTW